MGLKTGLPVYRLCSVGLTIQSLTVEDHVAVLFALLLLALLNVGCSGFMRGLGPLLPSQELYGFDLGYAGNLVCSGLLSEALGVYLRKYSFGLCITSPSLFFEVDDAAVQIYLKLMVHSPISLAEPQTAVDHMDVYPLCLAVTGCSHP
ncbi:hypothetical protein Acr_12g0001070 [Actinidia rufa]|uniref:Uncharacterized protein n=1 Tax=Actinidia rufa TaxID=165716 RepID=A0A7J0FGL1_9ERIC|nr:hypothetical protein Acr_12g0001070 [Actinidia rufa]